MATLPAQPLPPRHSFLDTPDLVHDLDPDTPPLSFVEQPDTQERTSSDTTIFTIYSMYGTPRASWAANPDSALDTSLKLNPDSDPPTHDPYRDSFYLATSPRASTISAYYSPESHSRSSSHSHSLSHSRASKFLDPSPPLPHDHRPPSSSWNRHISLNDDLSDTGSASGSGSASQSRPSSATTRSSHGIPSIALDPSAHPRPGRPPRSSPPRPKSGAEEDGTRLSSFPPSPSPNSITPSPPKITESLVPAPRTPSPSPSRNHFLSASNNTSPASSLVATSADHDHTSPPAQPPHSSSSALLTLPVSPQPGEDPESFHVRRTYAELELLGVEGDGFEDGVERTRARVGLGLGLGASASASSVGMGEDSVRREIKPEEMKVLASLDRYGFFVVPSHDRLVLLPSSAFSKPLPSTSSSPSPAPSPPSSTPHSHSHSHTPASPPLLPSAPHPKPPTKESPRIAKWDRMMRPRVRDEGANVVAWGVRKGKEGKVVERVGKGVPDRWRSVVWGMCVTRATAASAAFRSRAGTGTENGNGNGKGAGEIDVGAFVDGDVSAEVKRDKELGEVYSRALEKWSSYDIQIDLDVPRTISGHVMFRTRYGLGQRSLFHVLHSFSLHCSECGYCQGMGPLAATLLAYFRPEQAYAVMVRLHDVGGVYGMHDIWRPGFPGLLEAIYVQERVVERVMPRVFESMKRNMIATTSYATKWYITLFATTVPFQTQLRLWDVFFLEGRDVFVVMAVGVLWVFKDYLTSPEASFETILSLLSSFFVPEGEDALMRWVERAMGDKRLRADMKRWRTEWAELVRTGKDGGVLL